MPTAELAPRSRRQWTTEGEAGDGGTEDGVAEDVAEEVAEDDVATALDELEAKIRHQEQTIWVLTEYIETKGSEAFFEPVAEECLNIIQGINAETISVLQQRPAYNPALMNPY
jgi:hypothetical protein